MTFLDILYSLFIYIQSFIVAINFEALIYASSYFLITAVFITAVIAEYSAQTLPAVTWEYSSRARRNNNSLWPAVIECICNNHGELHGNIWKGYAKIKIEKSSTGDFRAISHRNAISLPDWQWSE